MRKYKQRLYIERKVFVDPMPSGFALIRVAESVSDREKGIWKDAGTVSHEALDKVYKMILRMRKHVSDYRMDTIRRDVMIRELSARLERRRNEGPVERNTQEWEDERTILYRAALLSGKKPKGI